MTDFENSGRRDLHIASAVTVDDDNPAAGSIPAADYQVQAWREATAAPSPSAIWSDYVVAALCARVAQDGRDLDDMLRSIKRLCEERDHWRHIAERRVTVRTELAEILGTDDVAEAVSLLRRWKAAERVAVCTQAKLDEWNRPVVRDETDLWEHLARDEAESLAAWLALGGGR